MAERDNSIFQIKKKGTVMATPIETIVIEPTKEMPFEIFRECYRVSYFMELMERLPDGKVLWDEKKTTIFDKNMAKVLYKALQKDMFSMSFEISKKMFEEVFT
ncbi:hypothetical protein QMN07_17475 [Leptospira santarosai]|nr:hypothetical protein [Leptospira santarosai]